MHNVYEIVCCNSVLLFDIIFYTFYSFGQVVVSIHFLALAILWITRDFGGNYGWAHAFKDK